MCLFHVSLAQTSPNVLTFQKRLEIPSEEITQVDLIRTQDQGYLILGRVNNVENQLDYFLFKYDDNDQLAWAQRFDLGADETVLKVEEISGGYLILGNANIAVIGGLQSNISPFLTEVQTNGTLVSTHYFPDDDFDVEASDFVWDQATESFAIYGRQINGPYHAFTIIQGNISGSLNWRKTYEAKIQHIANPNKFSLVEARANSIIQSQDGHLLITGSIQEDNQRPVPMLAKIHVSTGNPFWGKLYEFPSLSLATSGQFLHENTDGSLYIVGQSIVHDSGPICILKTDASGQLLWNKHYNILYLNDMHRAGNAFYLAGEALYFSGQEGVNLAKFDSNFDPVYQQHIQDGGCTFGVPSASISSSGNEVRIISDMCFPAYTRMRLSQMTPDATSVCPVDPSLFSSSSFQMNVRDLYTNIEARPLYYFSIPTTAWPFPPNENVECSGITYYNPGDESLRQAQSMTISPNPVQDHEWLDVRSALRVEGAAFLEIRRLGVWMRSPVRYPVESRVGENHWELDVRHLEAGTYSLSLVQNDQILAQNKFQKK